MRRSAFVVVVSVLVFFSAEAAFGKNVSRQDSQIGSRIFAAEQITIAQFSKRAPVLEAYIQSLDPESRPEAVLDDAYFLGKLGLDVDSSQISRFQSLAFGASAKSRSIRVNTGDRWPLYPDGYVDMLFVDLSEFDKEHYALTYESREQLGGSDCLRIQVQPLSPKSSGRFGGEIWVDAASFRIIRILGSFSPRRLGVGSKFFNPGGISHLGLYFHFESWRQQVEPGVWLPSYTYFDERRMWNEDKLTTSFHLRGHVWLWNYQELDQERVRGSLQNPVADLESSGLLASPGDVERKLNAIVQEIVNSDGMSEIGITCRVLLTTPAEFFSIDKTVFVSRGLLNLVPDESTLAGLLALEIAHVTLGHSQGHTAVSHAIFDPQRKTDFPGFRIQQSPYEEEAARDLMRSMLKEVPYDASAIKAEVFLQELARLSSSVPHLAKGRFGPPHEISRQSAGTMATLQLRGDYGISSWESRVVSLDKMAGSDAAMAGEAPGETGHPAVRPK